MQQTPLVRLALSDRLTLSPAERALYQDGERVKVGARALEILLVLAEEPGRLVSKDELMERVWPNQHVDEAALRVHLSALRRLLTLDEDQKLIVNESGRGYRLVPPVVAAPERVNPVYEGPGVAPAPIVNVIGRDDLIDRCIELSYGCRLISLCGAGGIGKTTIALAAARRIGVERGVRTVFLDLSLISETSSIRDLLAEQMGVDTAEAEEGDFWRALAVGPLLIVLDNCEHVIEPAAVFAENLLRHLPQLIILATSREPLRASGEWLLRVPPLDLPVEGCGSCEEASLSPAVQLFVERARAANAAFSASDDEFRHLVHICRRLDGIPLAIEMAATRLSVYSIQELDRLLVDRFATLVTGRRTALPRHRTLLATLDWSYDLLSDIERDTFRRVSVFRGAFTMEAAIAIVGNDRLSEGDIMETVSSLVAKSLLLAEQRGGETHYRMLETIRSYALRHLKADDAFEDVCRNHAHHVVARAARNHAPAEEGDGRSTLLGELRAALIWANGSTGDADVAQHLVEATPRILSRQAMPIELIDVRGHTGLGPGSPPEVPRPSPDCGDDSQRVKFFPARGDTTGSGELFEPRLILADLG